MFLTRIGTLLYFYIAGAPGFSLTEYHASSTRPCRATSRACLQSFVPCCDLLMSRGSTCPTFGPLLTGLYEM